MIKLAPQQHMDAIDVSRRQTAQSSLLSFLAAALWSDFEFGPESGGIPCWICDFVPWFGGFDEILKIIKSAKKMAGRWKMKRRHTEMGLASLLEPRPVGGQQAMSGAPHPTRCVCIGYSWRHWDMIFKMMAESPSKKACQNGVENPQFLQQAGRAWAGASWTSKPSRTSVDPSTGFCWFCQLQGNFWSGCHDFGDSGTWA